MHNENVSPFLIGLNLPADYPQLTSVDKIWKTFVNDVKTKPEQEQYRSIMDDKCYF